MKISISKVPDWWVEPSDNKAAKDMTKGQVIMDWLKRHNIQKKNGKYVFYHGTPKSNGSDTLKAGSLLATNKKDAAKFSASNKPIKEKDVKVIEVLVLPYEIDVGHWATLLKEYTIEVPSV